MKLNEELAYLVGVFTGDGSLYKSDNSLRVEFSDGSTIPNELIYSKKFLENIAKILKKNFGVKVKIRKRKNKFIVKFRSKFFCEWLKSFGFKPVKNLLILIYPKYWPKANMRYVFGVV